MKKRPQLIAAFAIFVTFNTLAQSSALLKGKYRGEKDRAIGNFNRDKNRIFKEDRVVFDLQQKGNKLTASYYDTILPQEHKIDSLFIPYRSFLTISDRKRGLEASILNIPFKVRPKMDTLASIATADLKNIGLFLGVSRTSKRYFYNGISKTHTFIAGGFVAPTLISLSKSNTDGELQADLSQLGLSIGLGINYTYKSISFILIPMGFDIGLGQETKNWIYNKKYWFGFGIGFDTTLLSF